MSYFSEKLKTAISSSGLSQSQIAALIGESKSNFSAFVRGKRPLSDDKLRKMASISELGLNFHTLKVWDAVDKVSLEVLTIAVNLLREEGAGNI